MENSTKEQLDDHLRENYPDYVTIAKRILGSKGHYNDIDNRSRLLVTEAYLHFSTCPNPIPSGKIRNYMIRHMHTQVIWTSTNLKKYEWLHSEEFLIHGEDYTPGESSQFSNRQEPVYEDTDTDRELVHYNKMQHIEKKVARLDLQGKKLYDLAIAGPYNTSTKLATYTGLPRTTCHYYIRDLKKYLQDGYTD